MGQAKLRGTREERVAAGILKRKRMGLKPKYPAEKKKGLASCVISMLGAVFGVNRTKPAHAPSAAHR